MEAARAMRLGLRFVLLLTFALGALLGGPPGVRGAAAREALDLSASQGIWLGVLRQYDGQKGGQGQEPGEGGPKEAEALFWVGVAYANLGRLEESRQALEAFEASDGRERASDEIVRRARRELAEDPANLRALNGLAFLSYDGGDYQGAAARFREIVRLDPLNPWARAFWGFCLGKAGRVDEGVAVLEEAVRQFPDNEVLHFLLGLGYYQKGMVVKALLEMAKAPRAVRYFR